MSEMTTKTVYFTMVNHLSSWMRVGNAYPSHRAAKEWLPFVRGAWRGLPTKVEPCRLVFLDGKLTAESKRLLDEKFNLDA